MPFKRGFSRLRASVIFVVWSGPGPEVPVYFPRSKGRLHGDHEHKPELPSIPALLMKVFLVAKLLTKCYKQHFSWKCALYISRSYRGKVNSFPSIASVDAVHFRAFTFEARNRRVAGGPPLTSTWLKHPCNCKGEVHYSSIQSLRNQNGGQRFYENRYGETRSLPRDGLCNDWRQIQGIQCT